MLFVRPLTIGKAARNRTTNCPRSIAIHVLSVLGVGSAASEHLSRSHFGGFGTKSRGLSCVVFEVVGLEAKGRKGPLEDFSGWKGKRRRRLSPSAELSRSSLAPSTNPPEGIQQPTNESYWEFVQRWTKSFKSSSPSVDSEKLQLRLSSHRYLGSNDHHF